MGKDTRGGSVPSWKGTEEARQEQQPSRAVELQLLLFLHLVPLHARPALRSPHKNTFTNLSPQPLPAQGP